MKHWAWLHFSEQVFWAEYEKESPYEPFSAVTELLQGIWHEYAAEALRIVRSRIFTTESYNDLSWAMVSIAGKRISFDAGLPDFSCAAKTVIQVHFRSGMLDDYLSVQTDSVVCETYESRAEWIRTQLSTVNSESNGGTVRSRFNSSRNIVAALFDSSSGEHILNASNRNAPNRTLHAEVILLQSYWEKYGSPLLANHELWTSREPCKMCAAMIATLWPDASMGSVRFLEVEDGAASRDSVLRRRGIGVLFGDDRDDFLRPREPHSSALYSATNFSSDT